MKKSLTLACLFSVFAVSSFAQSPANAAGAKLVAERDASYAKVHPEFVKVYAPVTHHAHMRHGPHRHHVMGKSVK